MIALALPALTFAALLILVAASLGCARLVVDLARAVRLNPEDPRHNGRAVLAGFYAVLASGAFLWLFAFVTVWIGSFA